MPYFTNDPAVPCEKQVVAGSVGDDTGAKRCNGMRILQDHIESIVHAGSFALTERRSVYSFRLAEQDECAIDDVWAKIP